jgi:ligand-binding sensor domain-containing protein
MAGTWLHPLIAILSRCPNRRAWLLSLIVTLACAGLPGRAAETAPPPAINLHHTSWTARDGAPAEVLTMAQTTDGWLWLGAASGLFRFDGVRFERYEPVGATMPATAISILNAQASGDLWIGYRFGGASLLHAGRLRNYSQRDGLPENGPVWGLEYDGDGRMWAATSAGLYYLDGQRWLPAASSWDVPRTGYKTLLRDRWGVLWAQGERGVYSLAPGAKRYDHARDSGIGSVFDVPGNGIWSWDARHNQLNRLTSAQNARPRDWQVHGDVTSLLFDHAGNLWVGRLGGLESHTASGFSHTGPRQGLSGNAVGALLEDREGNIWAATASGLDRFRAKRLSAIIAPESTGVLPLAPDPAGGAWIGRLHVTQPAAPVVTALWPSSSTPWHNVVTCDYVAPDGALWVGGFGGLWHKEGERLSRVALPDKLEGGQINSMVIDQAGGLWLAMRGLYRQNPDGSWEERGGKDGLPVAAPRAMVGAGKDLWFAYPQSRLIQNEGRPLAQLGAGRGPRHRHDHGAAPARRACVGRRRKRRGAAPGRQVYRRGRRRRASVSRYLRHRRTR